MPTGFWDAYAGLFTSSRDRKRESSPLPAANLRLRSSRAVGGVIGRRHISSVMIEKFASSRCPVPSEFLDLHHTMLPGPTRGSNMTEFTPLASLLGGLLIGLAAVLLMALHGRIMGLTGILSGLLPPPDADWSWRAAFLLGAISAPALIVALGDRAIPFETPLPFGAQVIGGLVVGIGAALGSGCTSGHGVCGLARLSPRSLVATCTFMVTALATVFVIRHLLGSA